MWVTVREVRWFISTWPTALYTYINRTHRSDAREYTRVIFYLGVVFFFFFFNVECMEKQKNEQIPFRFFYRTISTELSVNWFRDSRCGLEVVEPPGFGDVEKTHLRDGWFNRRESQSRFLGEIHRRRRWKSRSLSPCNTVRTHVIGFQFILCLYTAIHRRQQWGIE